MTRTVVILARHEDYSGAALTLEGAKRARNSGQSLEQSGLRIDWAASSPQWRCVQTVYEMLQGAGSKIPLSRVDERLGDMALDELFDENTKNYVHARARELNRRKAEILLEEDSLRYLVVRRGLEGAATLLEFVRARPGGTLLVCSHGGSRLEPTVCTLLGVPLSEAPFLFQRGAVAELVFEDLCLRSATYRGPLHERR